MLPWQGAANPRKPFRTLEFFVPRTPTPHARMLKTIQHGPQHTLRSGILVLVTTCLVSTVGYVIAGWSWLDSAYMVAITIFGVGYGEVQPVEGTGLKLFTIGVIFAGCSSVIYVIGGVVQLLAEGEIHRMLGVRNRSRDIKGLVGHTIICGYGRVGQMLAAELDQKGQPFVVIDNNPERVERAIHDGFLAMDGDAVDDECLQRAGIFRASALATVLPDDAANVFITLTARELSESIKVIARAENPMTERKLLRSGATNVVMPAAIGAVRIAQLATDDSQDAQVAPRLVQYPTDISEIDVLEVVESEVKELADYASDLSRTVAQKHIDQVREQEEQELPMG